VETGVVEEAVDDSVEEAVAGGDTAAALMATSPTGRGGRERERRARCREFFLFSRGASGASGWTQLG
jgi:hypothetical protein